MSKTYQSRDEAPDGAALRGVKARDMITGVSNRSTP